MAMAEYGIPYMGSKGEICNELIRIFPKADHFYDLFGGGFSVTHAMLLRRSKDYKQFHFNELRPGICDLIKDAIKGKYSSENFMPPWVSREEFFEKKDTDPYIKMIWSFGNSGNAYLFGRDVEEYKKSMHNAIVFNEFDDLAKKTIGMEKFNDSYSIKDRRLFLRSRIATIYKGKKRGDLQQLERLQRLQQLERLQQLQQLQRLEFYNNSYEKIKIKPNAIIYCDPPYAGTAKYDTEFDHKKFLDWCDSQKNPVFISEYNISDKRFKPIWSRKKLSRLTSDSRILKTEKVYANRAYLSDREVKPIYTFHKEKHKAQVNA